MDTTKYAGTLKLLETLEPIVGDAERSLKAVGITPDSDILTMCVAIGLGVGHTNPVVAGHITHGLLEEDTEFGGALRQVSDILTEAYAIEAIHNQEVVDEVTDPNYASDLVAARALADEIEQMQKELAQPEQGQTWPGSGS